MVRNAYVQVFFTLHSLCESCSTSQILLAHPGPHPPSKMSPDPCSDFSSSLDPSDHSPHPIAPSPLAAAPDPPFGILQFHNLHFTSLLPPSFFMRPPPLAAPNPPPRPVPERSSESSAPPSTPGSQGFAQPPQISSPDAPSPAPVLPSQADGARGIVWVHVPFSLTDLSQIEMHLGSFSSDPDNYLKEFRYLTQS